MSPISVTRTDAGDGSYGRPFIGPIDHTVQIDVKIKTLTDDEIDRYGYIKPGVPINKDGILVASGAVLGVTIEPIKVAASNSAEDIAAAPSCQLGIAVIGQVSQAIIEDNLGRALTSAEKAGFLTAGCLVGLILTTMGTES
jgi:hypothetical protein